MLKKNIVAFDVETTGLSVKDDYVIQLSAVKLDSELNIISEFNEYILPINDFVITEGAFGKHGMTKEFIAEHGKPLNIVATSFIEFVGDSDILSYNGNGFDVKMLVKDLRTVGIDFDLTKTFYDAFALEKILLPRTLEATYKRYTGQDMTNSHNALYDVYATVEVFKHQLKKFEEIGTTIDDIMNFDDSKILCLDGMLKRDGDKILFAKGKYKDVDFLDVIKKDPDYIKWFMNNQEFDVYTKQIAKNYYINHRAEMLK